MRLKERLQIPDENFTGFINGFAAAKRPSQSSDDFRALYNAVVRIGEREFLEQRLNTILEQILQLGFDRARIYMLDSDVLKCVAAKGVEEETWRTLEAPRSERSKWGVWHAFLSKKVVNVTDAKNDRRIQNTSLEKLGINAFACIPLIAAGDVIGVLVVDNKNSGKPITYGQLESPLMESLAATSALFLRDARARKEESRRRQILTTLIAAIAHDVKNPIITAAGFARISQRYAQDFVKKTDDAGIPIPDKAKENLQKVLRNMAIVSQLTETAERLVSELMEFLRIESDNVRPSPRELDLSEFIGGIIKSFEAQAKERGCKINMQVGDVGIVFWDRNMVGSIINNLVENAIKYSPNGGTISITISKTKLRNADAISISVADNGIGIPEEHLPHLFEPFHRVQTEETKNIKGTGVGLFIVKAYTEAHGGSVSVKSEHGVGSVFTVLLPTDCR
ncbi:MAG: GAF domain-containing sensor histidine kinase [Candidatus Micrarchaeia archaeon]